MRIVRSSSRMLSAILALSAAHLLLAACASSSAQEDVPAVIVEPTAASRAELAQTVSDALHGAPVTLADHALTTESVLIIERKPARDASGQRLSGRDFDRPDRFHLVRSGRQCILIHERTGTRYPLGAAQCAAQRPSTAPPAE